MGGFLSSLFSPSGSVKTDRGAELGARQSLWGVVGQGLQTGLPLEAEGIKNLSGLEQYFQGWLKPGREQAATAAAPAVNTLLAQSDAARGQAARLGTGRTGGTAALQREAGATTTKSIDDIINQTLQTGRTQATAGLQTVTDAQLKTALANLGMSQDAAVEIMRGANEAQKMDMLRQAQAAQAIGQIIGGIAGGIMGV